MKHKREDMTTVIKCASVSEAQKCAKFINDWQVLIYATWCSDEVTIKVRTQSPSDHAYYEPVDTSGLIDIKNPQSSVTKAKMLECPDCGGVIESGQVDHVCIRKGPEEYHSSNR